MNAPVCGSLFSGVGGMDLGLSRAGFRHAFFCEQDEWRRTILARHWPGVPTHHDVRDVAHPDINGRRGQVGTSGYDTGIDGAGGDPRPARMRGRSGHVQPGDGHTDIPDAQGSERDVRGCRSGGVDLLAGGFPCQDLSVAGRRAGLIDGARSSLFFEFARVADALVPPGGWVLIENVPGLLSSNRGRDLAVVLATLADLGFMDGAWRVLDARFFGVPQRRRRVFILARRAGAGSRARAVLFESEGGRGDLAPRYPAWAGAARGVGGGAHVAGSLSRRYGKGVKTTVDDGAVVVSTLGRGFGDRGTPDAEGAAGGHLVPVAFGHPQGIDPQASTEATPTIRRNGGGAAVSGHTSVRRLTPTECERLMGWPDGHTQPGPDSRRYAACGDGVVAHVAEWIGRRLLAEMRGVLDREVAA